MIKKIRVEDVYRLHKMALALIADDVPLEDIIKGVNRMYKLE